MGLAGDKNNWQNSDQTVLKVIEYCIYTDPRSAMNSKEKNDEEKHTCYYCQSFENQC